MSLKDIVNVNITRETRQVSRKGFGTPLILGINKAFTALIQSFSSLEEVATIFAVNSKEYISAQAFFLQSPTVKTVKIGRRGTTDTTTVSISTLQNSTLYQAIINGVIYSFVSDATATAIEICAGIVAVINAGSQPVTATASGSGTYTLVADVASAPYSLKLSSNQTASFVTNLTVAEDIDNIVVEDNDWYALSSTSRTTLDQANIALKIESMQKIFVAGTGEGAVVTLTEGADVETLPAITKASGATRTMSLFSGSASTQFIESAFLGRILPMTPGSWTGKFKTLVGITPDNATSTQRTNALAKNCSIYSEVGGVNIVEDGKVADGEYLDVIVFVDYLQSRITEEIYSTLVNQNKVPFTDAGITLIQSKINLVLQEGVELGGLASSPAFTITVPKASEISSADKASRSLNGIKFSATLAGAIHAVTINGTVSL